MMWARDNGSGRFAASDSYEREAIRGLVNEGYAVWFVESQYSARLTDKGWDKANEEMVTW